MHRKPVIIIAFALLAIAAFGQEVPERADTLQAAVFTEKTVRAFADHQKYYLGKEERNSFATGLEALKMLPGLEVKEKDVLTLGGMGVTILINWMPSTAADLSVLSSKDIKSIDYYRNPPARYAFMGTGAVINVLTRAQNIGGSLMLDLKGAVTTPWTNSAAAYRQVMGNTSLGIAYSNRMGNSGGYSKDEFQEYEALGNLYSKEKEGVPTHFKDNRHHVGIDLVKASGEKGAFKANFLFGFYRHDWPLEQLVTRTVTPLGEPSAGERTVVNAQKEDFKRYVTPSLDLYWHRTLSERHELSANLVGTYYGSRRIYGYSESSSGIGVFSSRSASDADRYSGIFEITDDWAALSGKISSGFRGEGAYSLMDNVSSGTSAESDIRTGLLRGWGAYSRTFGKLHITAGAAIEYDGYDSSVSGKAGDWHLRPMLALQYTLNPYSSFTLNYNSETEAPNVAYQSSVAYFKEDGYLWTGNPALRGSAYHRVNAGWSWNGIWDILSPYVGFTGYYGYGTPLPVFFSEDGLLVEQVRNVDRMSISMLTFGGKLRPFGKVPLSLSVYAMWYRGEIAGGKVDRKVGSLGMGYLLNYGGVKWSAEAFYRSPQGQFNDSGFCTNENYGYVQAYRRVGEGLRIGAGLRYPFYDWKVKAWTADNSQLRYCSTSYMASQKSTVYLACVYDFSYGRKERRIKKRLDNTDNDTGNL